MQGKAFRLLRVVAPIALMLTLLLMEQTAAKAGSRHRRLTLVGARTYYMAIGDSLAFGYQPSLNWINGYSNYFFDNLKSRGVTDYDNYACPGETTITMINGGCPYSYLKKEVYFGPQLKSAINYLHKHVGKVSPVTLDIGANDVLKDLNISNCSISANWAADLAIVDRNLTQVILPQLVAAMTVNGQFTGDLLLMNYYDPYQNICPNTVSYVQQLNEHLATDAAGFATLVDIFTPFGGAVTPDPNTCNYTWICSNFKDVHAKDAGYSAMATAFEQTTGY
ncbi:MAG TPA: SGNH/GDSL hydrolase family protein [Ktedonobacteraceae bacterium]|nr:SGNH/GDSL hydrolase family protein [Ktedonobacteraceae bacterium]